jgi:hypothetical protein
LTQLSPGDRIIAYQSNRNELVGVAEVRRLRPSGGFQDLILRPIEKIGARVRPLKKANTRIAAIPALQPGRVQTVYEIEESDAELLLQAARHDSHLRTAVPTAWRMAFRVGTGGEELWPQCLRHSVAAIHYGPVENVDLSKYAENEPSSRWRALKPSQRASLRAVAYEIKPDDLIFVKEGPRIVAKGVVLGTYFFDRRNRIVSSNGLAFQHQLPMGWETW